MDRPLLQDKSVQLHFVDDRAETLLHMAQQPHLQRWNLYFADWCAHLLFSLHTLGASYLHDFRIVTTHQKMH